MHRAAAQQDKASTQNNPIKSNLTHAGNSLEALEQSIKVNAVLDTSLLVCRTNTHLFTAQGNNLIRIRRNDFLIERKIQLTSNITQMSLTEEGIYICTAEGILFLYCPVKDVLEYILKEKMHTKRMSTYFNDSYSYLCLGNADGSILLFERNTKTIILKRSFNGSITCLCFVQGDRRKRAYSTQRVDLAVGTAMGEVLVLDIKSGNVKYKENTHSGAVTFLDEMDGNIYSASADGHLVHHSMAGERDRVKELGFSVCAGIIYNQEILLTDETNKIFHYNGNLISVKETVYECPPVHRMAIDGCGDLLLVTQESDVIDANQTNQLNQSNKTKQTKQIHLIGDNDEITDLLPINDSVVISTNSRMLRVIEKDKLMSSGEYACSGYFLDPGDPQECTLCLAGTENLFYAGTKDGYLSVFGLVNQNNHQITHLSAIKASTNAAVTALYVHKDNTLIAGFEDGLVKAWRVTLSNPTHPTMILLFTTAVSSSEITSVCVTQGLILCASKDKGIHRMTLKGHPLPILLSHRKSVWALSSTTESLLSASSDGTAQVRASNSLSPTGASTATAQMGHSVGVVRGLLLQGRRALTATTDGVLHLWDTHKEKEIAALRVAQTKKDRIWSIKQIEESKYLVSTGSTLVVVKDNTREIEEQKEALRRAQYITREHAESLGKRGLFLEAAIEYFRIDLKREMEIALGKVNPQEEDISCLVHEMEKEKHKSIKYLARWSKSQKLFLLAQKVIAQAMHKRWPLEKDNSLGVVHALIGIAERMNEAY